MTSSHVIPSISQWLQPNNSDTLGPSIRPSTPVNLNEIFIAQQNGLHFIAQQLLTYNIQNVDYNAILLSQAQDNQQLRKKIVEEAEEKGNVDGWLIANIGVEFDEALCNIP